MKCVHFCEWQMITSTDIYFIVQLPKWNGKGQPSLIFISLSRKASAFVHQFIYSSLKKIRWVQLFCFTKINHLAHQSVDQLVGWSVNQSVRIFVSQSGSCIRNYGIFLNSNTVTNELHIPQSVFLFHFSFQKFSYEVTLWPTNCKCQRLHHNILKERYW